MARRRTIGSGKRRNRRVIGAPVFDIDARRGEINLDPKDPPRDYKTGLETIRPAAAAQNIKMPARPLLCKCGSRSFELRGVHWVCIHCNPQPAQAVAARDVVTIPENIPATERDALRAGWELIQQKRAADGLRPMAAIAAAQPAQPVELDAEFLRCWKIVCDRQSGAMGWTFPPVKVNPASDDIELVTYTPIETARAIIRQTRKEVLYPEKYMDVVFYAELGIEAARRHSLNGGGWRLWQLGKALDKAGTGRIKRDALRNYLVTLGVNGRTIDRWFENARNNDFISDIQSAAGEWLVILHNPGIVGASMKSERLSRRVVMPAMSLIGKGWKARVFAAYQTIYNGQPISRGRLQIISNVPMSTQKYREAQAGVKRITNIAQVNRSADQLPMIREYARNPFAFFIGRDGNILQRLPNSYQYTKAQRGNKGRARKINRIISSIQSQDALSTTRQGLSDGIESSNNDMIRLFNRTPDATKRTLKKLARIDNRKVNTIFEEDHRTRRGAVIWRAVDV